MTLWERIRGWFGPPVFEGDEDKTRVAGAFHALWLVLAVVLIGLVVMLFTVVENKAATSAITGAMGVVLAASRVVLLQGRVQGASLLFLGFLGIIFVVAIVLSGGAASPALFLYFVFVVMVAMLVGERAALAVAVFFALLHAGLAIAHTRDVPLPVVLPMSVGANWPLVWLALAATMTPLWITVRSLTETLERARSSASELEAQQVQLQDLVQARTQELVRRTAYLGATTEVAREAVSVAGDLAQLLQRIAEVIGEQFGLYHVGVFLVDARNEWADLHAASSEGGKRMLAREHRLRLGTGVVGSVAQQGMHRIALDVDRDVAFQANPDLPETRSEMALPLRVRSQVIGVLDVQSTEPAAFVQEDVAVLQALADQVSVAIDNVRLSAQMQSALEAERTAYGELSQRQWQALLAAEPDLGFVSDATGITAAGTLWEPQMEAAVKSGEAVTSEENVSAMSIPIRIRDQVVGVVDGLKPDGSRWTPEEMELLQAMTEQLNVALEGARLYRETQRRAAQEQVIGQVTRSIRQSLEIDEVLRMAAEQIREALGLGKAVVRLAVPEEVLANNSDGGEQE